jgi:phage shock protein PspC (stress-responsive transcriptional regulator)
VRAARTASQRPQVAALWPVRPGTALAAVSTPVRLPVGSLPHVSIIAPHTAARLSGQTLSPPVASSGWNAGVFRMAWLASWPHAGAMNETTANPEASSPTTTSPEASSLTRPQPLCRPIQDRMLAGVAAGIARYLGVDATIVRIAFAVLVVTGGIGLPIYLAGWLLIPEEGSEQSIASELIQSLQTRSH